MIKHANFSSGSLDQNSPYPPPPTPVANRIPTELEPIFHSILGAAARINVQNSDLTEALSRAIGRWPQEASNEKECAPDRDGLIPAIAAACDALHAAIDRMQDPVNRARTL